MAQSRVGSSGNRVLAELSQNPTARKNKYDELKRKFDALERHADFLATRLEDAEKRGSQPAYNAILKQLQNAETRINNLATEMNSIAESSRYSAEQERRQQRIDARKPKTTMDKVRESLPYAIGSGIRDLIVDTGKGIGQTALYAENQLRTGKAGTQGSVMNPENFTMGDVAGEYATALGENTGFYLDALNSMMHWRQGRLKPDSEDEKYAKMFGGKMRDMVGTKPLEDQTVLQGARILADPFVVGSRVKLGVDAVTDPKLWQGIARDMSAGTRSQMFMPVVKWSDKGRTQPNEADWLGGYSPQIQDAYKKFEELSAQGVDPREIFRQTRIFKNVDGIPYFETDDSLAKFGAQEFRDAIASGKKGVPLRQAMSHPELTDADYAYNSSREKYVLPQKELGASYSPTQGLVYTYPNTRTWSSGKIQDDFPSNIIHESNHMLANQADLYNSGSNIPLSVKQLNEYKRNLDETLEITPKKIEKLKAQESKIIAERQKLIDRMSLRGGSITMDEYAVLAKQRKELDKKLESIVKRTSALERRTIEDTKIPAIDAYNLYQRNNGEALSRMAEARMALDDTARREAFPLDEDYFRKTTGYTPDETWFNKYDINKYRYENDLTFPLDIQQKLIDYLDKGKAPYKPRKGMKKI